MRTEPLIPHPVSNGPFPASREWAFSFLSQKGHVLNASVGLVKTEYAEFDVELRLESGRLLGPLTIAFERYGKLNAARDNVILVFHALTGSQHAAGECTAVPEVGELWTDELHTGWWEGYIGPGRGIDTDRYAVLCVNYLGGCYGSTGPASPAPGTGRPYGSAFPRLAFADIVVLWKNFFHSTQNTADLANKFLSKIK